MIRAKTLANEIIIAITHFNEHINMAQCDTLLETEIFIHTASEGRFWVVIDKMEITCFLTLLWPTRHARNQATVNAPLNFIKTENRFLA